MATTMDLWPLRVSGWLIDFAKIVNLQWLSHYSVLIYVYTLYANLDLGQYQRTQVLSLSSISICLFYGSWTLFVLESFESWCVIFHCLWCVCMRGRTPGEWRDTCWSDFFPFIFYIYFGLIRSLRDYLSCKESRYNLSPHVGHDCEAVIRNEIMPWMFMIVAFRHF